MTRLILYIFCLSGSALAAALGSKRAAWCVPILPLGAALLCGIAGLCSALTVGAVVALLLGAACWTAALLLAVRRGFGAAARRFFSPAWLIFTLLCLFSVLGSRGMQVHTWDEFSHWAYSVQEMCLSGRLYTDAASDAIFKAYPPLMPLWQYLGQTVNRLLTGNAAVDGALLYFGSQLLGVCLLTPFLYRLRWKRPIPIVLSAFVCLGLPLILYTDYFRLVYIDAFLGLLAGCVFALIALGYWRRPLGLACLALCEAALTLTKDSGLALAAVSLLYLLACVCADQKQRQWRALLIALAAVALAKGIWSVHLHTAGIASNGLRVDWRDLLRLISGRAEAGSYRLQVLHAFGQFLLYDDSLKLTVGRWPLSYLAGTVLLIVGGAAVLGKRRGGLRLAAFSLLNACIYLLGLLLLYLYYFGAYNGLRIASGARYIKTLLLCLAAADAAIVLHGIGGKKPRLSAAVLLALFLALPSWGDAAAYAKGDDTVVTAAQASGWQQAAQQVAEQTGGTAEARACVWVLIQTDDDLDYYALHYYLRPSARINAVGWHLSAEAISLDHNEWVIEPEEWAQQLLSDYDFVYVFRADDELRALYGSLFAGEIADGALYRVEGAGMGVQLSAVP